MSFKGREERFQNLGGAHGIWKIDLRKAYNLAPRMRILCHTGVRRPTANFCRLPNCISWRWKLGPLPWFVFLGSVWTWDLHRRSFISLVILVPERGCFPQTGHQIRRLVRQAVPFSQCFGEARINRHPEIDPFEKVVVCGRYISNF